MDLEKLQRNWDEFGKRDPLWAILTLPDKRNGKWNVRDFFAKGEEEIASVMQQVLNLNPSLPRGRALDFGCGVGRLTQAMCRYFKEAVGVDIAPSMIELANQYNKHGNRCAYYVNDAADLSLFNDRYFDFIYSRIVLQHMVSEYSQGYIREFLRVLAPHGMLVFQVPSEPKSVVAQHTERLEALVLPDDAFRAQITVQQTSIKATVCFQENIHALVTNVSPRPWPHINTPNGQYEIRLGNHWLQSGRVVAYDDARTVLPREVLPQESVVIELPVTIPSKPGKYILELDMMQEAVGWFKDKGSPTVQMTVEASERGKPRWRVLSNLLQRTRAPHAIADDPILPRMEMHGIPRPDVEKIIADNGGEVLAVIDDDSPGPTWTSYLYFVTLNN